MEARRGEAGAGGGLGPETPGHDTLLRGHETGAGPGGGEGSGHSSYLKHHK